MAAIRFLSAVTLRRHWRSILVLSLLVGIAGTVVIAAAAGGRRTATALGRFEAASRTADAEISAGDATPEQLRAFRREESVGAVAPLRQLSLLHRAVENLNVAGALDDRFGRVVDRARMVSGRPADPSAVDEVSIGEALADQLGVAVGDRVPFTSFTQQQVDTFLSGRDAGRPNGPRVTLRVVGIHRRPLDLGARGERGGVVVTTPAFAQKYAGRIGSFGAILRVRARHGVADLPRLTAAAREIFGGSSQFAVQPLGFDTEGARDAIGVLTVALWMFAAIAGAAALVAIAIVLSRQVALTSGDQPTLRALGLTRRQRAAAASAMAVPVAAGGVALAALGAALASPLLPFGVARRAEPDPGLRLDWEVLGLGGLTVVAVVVLVAFLTAIRVTGPRANSTGIAPGTRGFAVPAAMLRRLPASMSIGSRMAFEPGRGRTAVPVRSALVGAAFGALGVVAALTFASSLHHLATTPAQYGWTWDVEFEDTAVWQNGSRVCRNVETQLVRAPSVAAVAAVCDLNIEVDGHPVTGYGFAPLRGTSEPAVVAGRAPRDSREIALGTSTLDTLGKTIGDRVRVSGEAGVLRYRIVGRVVLPLQAVSADPQPLADGATFTGEGLSRLDEPAGNGNTNLIVRFAPEVDHEVATEKIASLSGINVVNRRPALPVEIDRLRQLDWLPIVLAAFVGLLAVVAVGHALVTAVRRRRSDLAVLKTLGFYRRQVRATVAWQATALTVVGLVIGIPPGLVAGRIVWGLVADGLGVATSATVPILGVLAIVVGGIAVANLTAAIPARTAARTPPAVVLRSE